MFIKIYCRNEYFPDCLLALSRTLLCFFLTTFVETAVYVEGNFFLTPGNF